MYILNCSHEKILTTSRYYATSFFTGSMMINYRVEDLHGLLDELKKEGINPVDKIDTASYGYFVHIVDLEGNKIKLWQANNDDYSKITDGVTW